MKIDFKGLIEKTVRRSLTLLNELTPKERKAVIVIVFLVIAGAIVKALRGV